MHTEHKREAPNVELGYETRDVNYQGLIRATVGFFVFAIGSFILGWIMLVTGFHFWFIKIDGFNPHYTDPKPNHMRRIPPSPTPLLQNNVSAKLDISKLRDEEDVLLLGTAYKDATKTKARIPVDRAMDLLVQRGIAPAPAEIPAKTVGHVSESFDKPVSNEPTPGGN